MKRKLQSILIVIFLVIIAFLICMNSPVNPIATNMEDYTDSSVFKYIGWSMTQGKVPYIELFDHKGPMIYFINYIGTIISQTNGIWIIEFVFMCISLYFTYKLARKFTSKFAALLITLITFMPMRTYFDGGNLTEEYALPFQIIALNIFFDFFLHPEKYSGEKKEDSVLKLDFKWFNIPVFICGICFSCVLFLRPNMISVWFVFCIMVFMHCILEKKRQELIKFIISFIGGILVVAIPIAIYLICHGAWQDFVNDYILFNMKYSNNTGKIDKLNVVTQFCSATVIMLALVIMVIKTYYQLKNKKKWCFNFGYLIFMLMTILFASMSGKYYRHYGMMIIPSLIYPYCIMYQFFEERKESGVGLKLVATSYLLITLIVPNGLNFVQNFLTKMANRYEQPYSNKIIEYIKENTEEEDFISVFGNRDNIYYLTNRQSVSKYSYQLPVATVDKNIMVEYLNDLATKKPKIIVYSVKEEVEEINKETTKIMREFLAANNYKIVQKDEIMLLYELEQD